MEKGYKITLKMFPWAEKSNETWKETQEPTTEKLKEKIKAVCIEKNYDFNFVKENAVVVVESYEGEVFGKPRVVGIE